MSLTGVIYGGIVLLWLCYLVPLALKRYDDASRSRSVERFSTAMRILGRTEAVDPAAARRPDDRAVRPASRAAARRRRWVLALLLGVTAATAAGCVFVPLSWWVLAAPGALVVGFLVVARVQVARARTRAARRPPVAARRSPEPVRAPELRRPPVEQARRLEPSRPPAEPVPVLTGGSLWDPVPVTLPTYVSKPRATRTVRTVDLGSPGVQTSGRLTADESARAAEPAVDAAAGNATAGDATASRAGKVSDHAPAVGD